ncbi:MAG TPA: Ig-like domain-containing protein, partial [Chthonomonadaceae bacterium]|nr:Ig-like domain-containing protein [Chthonomonadaceae bacterium]
MHLRPLFRLLPILALLALCIGARAQCTVTTDKPDYAPGDTVYITGSGFQPGETVTLQVVHTDGTVEGGAGHDPWNVTADGDGNIASTWYVDPDDSLGSTLQLTATGASSGCVATATLTDSVTSVTITSPTNGSPVTITSLPANVTISFNYVTSPTGTTTGQADVLGIGVSNTKNLTPGTGSDSITVTIPAGTANSSYNVKVTVTNTTGTGSNNKNDNQNAAVIINVPTIVSTSLLVNSATGTYGGTVNLQATLTAGGSGVSGKSISFTLNGTSVGSSTTNSSGVATLSGVSLTGINAGSYLTGVGASFSGDSGYNPSSATNTLTVSKADATIVVTPYNVTYDGNPHTATGTATGVGGVDLSAGLTLTGTTHTNAGDYPTDAWSFAGGTNYNDASGTVHDHIAKADATIAWSNPADITYGTALSAIQLNATASVPGSFVYTPTAGTVLNAGNGQTLHVDFTPSDTTNFNGTSKDVTINVLKANATIVVTPYNVTYDGNAHTATGTATGVNGESLSGLDLSGTTHTNAGTYNGDPWTFTDVTGNYNNKSSTVDDKINKADANISVTGYSVTYDGNPHTATGTATGVKGESLSGLDLSSTTHTNAGDYPSDAWTFTDATGNYNNANSTVHDHIDKADATIHVTPYDVTYDGNEHTATGTATGVKGESLSGLNLDGTKHTNAGTYSDTWTFTDVTGNYKDASDTVTDKIAKADATIHVTGYTVTYDGNAHTATGTATGVNGESLSGLDLSGTTHTNAGTYNGDPWT